MLYALVAVQGSPYLQRFIEFQCGMTSEPFLRWIRFSVAQQVSLPSKFGTKVRSQSAFTSEDNHASSSLTSQRLTSRAPLKLSNKAREASVFHVRDSSIDVSTYKQESFHDNRSSRSSNELAEEIQNL